MKACNCHNAVLCGSLPGKSSAVDLRQIICPYHKFMSVCRLRGGGMKKYISLAGEVPEDGVQQIQLLLLQLDHRLVAVPHLPDNEDD